MTTFIVTELQNANSSRKGESIEAADLASAKRKAARMQMFQGTVLEIATENGVRLAIKRDGKWETL